MDVEEERRTGCWAKMASKDGGEAGSAIFLWIIGVTDRVKCASQGDGKGEFRAVQDNGDVDARNGKMSI